MAWQTPKTDWNGDDSPSDVDMNRIEGNSQALSNSLHTVRNVTVPNTSWTESSGFYYKDVSDTWFNGADNETVDVYPTLASQDVALVLAGRVDTYDGGFRIWAREIPEAAIVIDYKGQRQVT